MINKLKMFKFISGYLLFSSDTQPQHSRGTFVLAKYAKKETDTSTLTTLISSSLIPQAPYKVSGNEAGYHHSEITVCTGPLLNTHTRYSITE